MGRKTDSFWDAIDDLETIWKTYTDQMEQLKSGEKWVLNETERPEHPVEGMDWTVKEVMDGQLIKIRYGALEVHFQPEPGQFDARDSGSEWDREIERPGVCYIRTIDGKTPSLYKMFYAGDRVPYEKVLADLVEAYRPKK